MPLWDSETVDLRWLNRRFLLFATELQDTIAFLSLSLMKGDEVVETI